MPFTKPTLSSTANYPTQVGRLVDIVEGPAQRNFVRNGDFMIAQRGTSFAGITSNQYTIDGWIAGAGGTNTVTQQAFTVGQTDVPLNPQFFFRIARTIAAGASNVVVQHHIERPDRLAGKTVTVSFYAKVSSGTKALVFDFTSTGVTSAIDTSDGGFTATTTWTLFTFTVAIPTMTAVTSSAALTARIQETASLGTFTLDIADFQIEIGSEATYFERLEYLYQLIWAFRFLQKSFDLTTVPAQGVSVNSGETTFMAGKAGALAQVSSTIPFPNRMRTAPTLTLYNPGAANAQVRDETAGADCSAAATANVRDSGFIVTATGNASTAVGNRLGIHWLATAEL